MNQAMPDNQNSGDRSLNPPPVFGEWLRGIYASERNPQRDGMYVRTIRRTGRTNPGTYYELTDGKGSLWSYPVQSVERTPKPAPAMLNGVEGLSPIYGQVPTVEEARTAIGTALDDAAKALRVLSTMLKKEKLMQGYAVADEILGRLGYATKLNAALAQQPAMLATHPAAAVDEAVSRAYDAGFRVAANWMERDDLHADCGSQAYAEDQAAALSPPGRAEGEVL